MNALLALRRLAGSVLSGRDDSRPRAVWRVLVPVVAVFVLGIAGTMLAFGAFGVELSSLVQNGLFALATLVVLVTSARRLDRRPIREYGFEFDRTWAREFVLGSILGTAMNGLVFVAAVGLGWATVTDWFSAGGTLGFATGMLAVVVGYLLTGFWEETLFRGIVLTNAWEGLSARGVSDRTALAGAVGLSTVLFAAVHLNQVPSLDALPYMFVTWTLMGGLLALLYVLTGSLAFPIGLHFAVNLSANNLFGLTGEWGTAFPSLVRLEIAAPEWALAIDGLLGYGTLHVGAILVTYVCLAAWVAKTGRPFDRSISDRIARSDDRAPPAKGD